MYLLRCSEWYLCLEWENSINTLEGGEMNRGYDVMYIFAIPQTSVTLPFFTLFFLGGSVYNKPMIKYEDKLHVRVTRQAQTVCHISQCLCKV